MERVTPIILKPSCETMNTRENFWNVYCFMTSQMWDEIYTLFSFDLKDS